MLLNVLSAQAMSCQALWLISQKTVSAVLRVRKICKECFGVAYLMELAAKLYNDKKLEHAYESRKSVSADGSLFAC